MRYRKSKSQSRKEKYERKVIEFEELEQPEEAINELQSIPETVVNA
jgi:hypothetical protein